MGAVEVADAEGVGAADPLIRPTNTHPPAPASFVRKFRHRRQHRRVEMRLLSSSWTRRGRCGRRVCHRSDGVAVVMVVVSGVIIVVLWSLSLVSSR